VAPGTGSGSGDKTLLVSSGSSEFDSLLAIYSYNEKRCNGAHFVLARDRLLATKVTKLFS